MLKLRASSDGFIARSSCWWVLDVDRGNHTHNSCSIRLCQHGLLAAVFSFREADSPFCTPPLIFERKIIHVGPRLIPHLADVGTSSKQWGDGKNWSDEPDVCLGNVVRDNDIRTRVRHSKHNYSLSPPLSLSLSRRLRYKFKIVSMKQATKKRNFPVRADDR